MLLKKENENKDLPVDVENVDVYRLPEKKLDIRYSGSPVCYSDNDNNNKNIIVVGMIADNEDENYCLSIPMHIILRKFEVNDVTQWIKKGFSLYESGEVQTISVITML